MAWMAVAVKKLDVTIGDLVEIDGYDVVSDEVGGITLEPATTRTVAEHGGRPLSSEELEEL